MTAKYGMQETHSIVLIQQPIWSYKQTMWAPVESADEKKRLPTTLLTLVDMVTINH